MRGEYQATLKGSLHIWGSPPHAWGILRTAGLIRW